MDFLKEVLGEELYNQFAKKVNAYNGNEENKEKPIKIGNLGTGDYVGKGKYEALQSLIDGKDKELATANGLIADLKKGNKDNEGLQAKITEYESAVSALQTELANTKLENAIKVGLLESHASDIDYLTFKLKAKGEALELGDDGRVKGWDDKLSGLKVQFPSMFEGSGNKKFIENKLPEEQNKDTLTKSEVLKMSYADRAKLASENPELYASAMNS